VPPQRRIGRITERAGLGDAGAPRSADSRAREMSAADEIRRQMGAGSRRLPRMSLRPSRRCRASGGSRAGTPSSSPSATASGVGEISPDGIPYLAPEIQLFYKAKQPRPKDQTDFLAILPYLTTERRRRLSEALSASFGTHPWQEQLAW
jgi:hypothetical protein